jgi:hypothetical protein
MHHLQLTLPDPGTADPTIHTDDRHALAIAHLTRKGQLPRGWRDSLGAYLLLSERHPGTGEYLAYAGSAYSAGLGNRLPRQWAQHPWADHAWVLRRTTTTGLTSPQAVALEDHLWKIAKNARSCVLVNQARPPRMPLPAAEREWLRGLLDPLLAILAEHGYDLTTPRIVTLKDLQDAGLLRDPEVLYPLWKPYGIEPAVLSGSTIIWDGQSYDARYPSRPARLMRGCKKTSAWQYLGVERDGRRISLGHIRKKMAA